MGEKYTGSAEDRRYTSDDVDVAYSLKRCIHARECVERLGEVFDVNKRPWIQPANASGDALVEVVAHCPSGALHTERKDGGTPELVPTENVVTVLADSYYRVRGNLKIEGSNVAIEQEVRAALCRCGLSSNKPFCDNSHKGKFEGEMGEISAEVDDAVDMNAPLHIHAIENGSLELDGPYEIRDEAGNLIARGSHTWLCRCGHSANKPFCDATHKRIGFEAP